jgi:hypothetical protein
MQPLPPLKMVEPARKHGPFDSRYPTRPKLAARNWELRPDEEGAPRLDWSVFMAQYFPGRRRHDLEVLAAYEAYRNRLEQGPPQQRSIPARCALDGAR